MIQSNYTQYVRLCVHYLGNLELSGLSVCTFMRTADTPLSAQQFVKMFHLFEPRYPLLLHLLSYLRSENYGVPKGSKSYEVVDHSVHAYFDIHVHV